MIFNSSVAIIYYFCYVQINVKHMTLKLKSPLSSETITTDVTFTFEDILL